MGSVDMERQALNVFRMRLMGAEVRGVEAGQKTLKEAVNEAMRDWVTNVRSTHYVLGTAYGSHPYPMMVRDFQRVIGLEAKEQIREREGRLPDELIACVGGGSNAIGLFFEFLEEPGVRMFGVEAGGRGVAGEGAPPRVVERPAPRVRAHPPDSGRERVRQQPERQHTEQPHQP